ncbi:MAG TPA: hypothetical protein VGI95_13385 [Caulobacteraceae bacterium]|jgi:hypothetical protein
MAHEPTWARSAVPKAKTKGPACVASMLLVAGMGAAFWMGAIWASQSWIGLIR